MPRLTPEQREELVHRYVAGARLWLLAKEYGVSPVSVRSLLKHRGVYEIRDTRKFKVRDDAFDDLTQEEAAYWAGFITADGCIRHNKVRIGLKASDAGHLRKLMSFVESKGKISTRANNGSGTCTCQFSSRQIVECLRLAGIGETKTERVVLEPVLANSRHFWRGVIDGDGTVCVVRHGPNRIAVLSLCGSPFLLDQFASFLRENGLNTKAQPHPGKGCWQFSLGHALGQKAIDLLYTESAVHLDRKKKAANDVLALPNGSQRVDPIRTCYGGDLEKELWEPVPWLEGYEFSNRGRVRSFWSFGSSIKSEKPVRALSQFRNKKGRMVVRCLFDNGNGRRRRSIEMHRIVNTSSWRSCQ